MPRGDKSECTDKPAREAARATVNTQGGGKNPGGSGRTNGVFKLFAFRSAIVEFAGSSARQGATEMAIPTVQATTKCRADQDKRMAGLRFIGSPRPCGD